MTQDLAELVQEVARQLRQADANGVRPLDDDAIVLNPEEEAELIVAEAASRQPRHPQSIAYQLASRRQAGELLGCLLGRVEFLDCAMFTARNCVVPRKATELLGRACIAALRYMIDASDSRQLRAVDMCCGAGNLACAVASRLPVVYVWATDLTEGCCGLARRNVSHLGLESRVTVFQGDLFAALSGQRLEGTIDLVCCNPPYISSTRLQSDRSALLACEPREAFDGGPYGLTIHQRVLHDATEFLRPRGWLMLEIGVGQERQLELLIKRNRQAYGAIHWKNDELGRPRVAAVQRTEQGL